MNVENLSDILALSSEEHNQVENDHTGTPSQIFNVDPENLTTVPGVENVVDGSYHSWHHRECNLEKRVPVHSTIVLSPQLKLRPQSFRLEKPAVTNSEKLKAGQYCKKLNETVCFRVLVPVFLKQLIMLFKSVIIKFVPQIVHREVSNERHRHNRCASRMFVSYQENEHVNPEEYKCHAFQSNKCSEAFSESVNCLAG
jgi:hypothetical protein